VPECCTGFVCQECDSELLRFSVNGLKCAVRDGRGLVAALRNLPCISAVDLDFPTRILTVSSFLDPDSIIDAVWQLGAGSYSASIFNPSSQSITSTLEAPAPPPRPRPEVVVSLPPPPPQTGRDRQRSRADAVCQRHVLRQLREQSADRHGCTARSG
jgi:hypothetical protein